MNISVDTKKLIITMTEKCYSVKELAEEADVSPQAISNVLNGTRSGTTKVLGKICKALGIQVRDVVKIVD